MKKILKHFYIERWQAEKLSEIASKNKGVSEAQIVRDALDKHLTKNTKK